MLDFISTDNSYASMRTAANFTTALQASLSVESGVEWVERQQLEQARHELELGAFNPSAAAAVRSGKWLKADLLVLGRFNLMKRKDGAYRWRSWMWTERRL